MSIEKLGNIWPEWNVVEQLGEGSFGKVYKVVREGHGVTSTAAVKVISIPQNDAELASLRSEGLDETGTRSYFEGIVTDFVNEIKLMESMKGTSNIVSVEDYQVLEKTDKIGWDIFIRMELLTPLNDYTAERMLTESEVIKLGQDVCSALELCAQRGIIHRDIKPENIFVSSFGDFKIGDFGIARKLEKTSDSLSRKGTPNYMAPEIHTSKDYDATVDIYSLGLVLHKLLNNNRPPFLDPTAQLIQYQDRQNANVRRLNGEPIPAPINASPHMAQIILAACAFDPTGRFKTPTAFKNALGTIVGQKPSPAPAPLDLNATTAVRRAPKAAQPNATQSSQQNTPTASFGKKKKSGAKKGVAIFVALILIVGVAAGMYFVNPGGVLDGFLGNVITDDEYDYDISDDVLNDVPNDVVSTPAEEDNEENDPDEYDPLQDEASQDDLENEQQTIAQDAIAVTVPVSLFDLAPVNSNRWNPNQGALEDSLGNQYSVLMPYIILDGHAFGEFFVDSRYSLLRGSLAPHVNLGSNSNVQFMVFADDKLVYSSAGISRTTLPFDFEADISGAQFVRVRVSCTDYWNQSVANILVMDMALESNQNDIVAERPLSLLTMTPVNSNRWNPNQGALEDSLGNRYTVTLPYIIIDGHGFGEFFVDSRYSTLRGRLAPYRNLGSRSNVQFMVYADGRLVYSSAGIQRTTIPFDFEVDISGAQFIRIDVSCNGYWNQSVANILVMDMILD